MCGSSEASLCPPACAPTLGCSSEFPRIVQKGQAPWASPPRIKICTESLGLHRFDSSAGGSKAVLKRQAGSSCSLPQGPRKLPEGRCKGPLPFFSGGYFLASQREVLPQFPHSISGHWGPVLPAHPGPLQGAGGWEERGAALALTLALLLPSPTPFSELSPSLAKGSGVGWGWPTELTS